MVIQLMTRKVRDNYYQSSMVMTNEYCHQNPVINDKEEIKIEEINNKQNAWLTKNGIVVVVV